MASAAYPVHCLVLGQTLQIPNQIMSQTHYETLHIFQTYQFLKFPCCQEGVSLQQDTGI